MAKDKKTTISVQGTAIAIVSRHAEDYVSLTDIAHHKKADHSDDLIRNWLRNRNTVEFLGIWEKLHNPDFNPVEFDGIKMQAGLNSFAITPKQWIEKTGASGIVSQTGRYGGTYAKEADVLNVALFGQTACEWREANPAQEGNMRDYAAIEQLLVLANIEGMNAEFIHMGLAQSERLKRLNQIAIRQMQTLMAHSGIARLPAGMEGKE